MSVLENNIRNLNINELIFTSLIKKNEGIFNSDFNPYKTNDILNKSLLNFYGGIDLEDKKEKRCEVLESLVNIDIIFKKIIKYKNLGGMKFEISGRLTRRYRADRAKFIRRIFGGLNNIDSSFKKKSVDLVRGYMNANVQYA
jgi:hypothetical protein